MTLSPARVWHEAVVAGGVNDMGSEPMSEQGPGKVPRQILWGYR